MSIFELILIAIGLSLDAFAVSVSYGLSMKKATLKSGLILGLYFGLFQAAMPLIGYLVGSQFADIVGSLDHWIAFILLAFIGIKMIIDSFKADGCADRACPNEEVCQDRACPRLAESSLRPGKLLPLAIATSIDALAAGVSFAFVNVQIFWAIFVIGMTTFLFSLTGVKIGNLVGRKFKARATLLGGVILFLMGLKILLEHLNILVF